MELTAEELAVLVQARDILAGKGMTTGVMVMTTILGLSYIRGEVNDDGAVGNSLLP